jgi:hypothetical protein
MSFIRFQILALGALLGCAIIMPFDWHDVFMSDGYILQRVVKRDKKKGEICVSE